jgi:thiamine biosynthesis lipoprotein
MMNRRKFLTVTPNQPVPSEGYWLHVNRSAMACRFEVTLPIEERAGVRVAAEALDEIDRLEAQLTVFRESSEVSQINQQAAATQVQVEASLFALLVLCQQLHRETEGAFDITSGCLSRCWGFLRRQGKIPGTGELEQVRALVGSEKLLLDLEARTIRFDRPGIEINLGSIGKGYALDRIGAMIGGRVKSALLSAGASSMCAIGGGVRGQRGWVAGVRHPNQKDKRLAVLRLRDVAMSTSGSEEQFFELDGKRYGHIIDPRTGWPAESVASVTVLAESAAVTDALATAFYVGGRELAEAYCASHPDILVLMLESGAGLPILIGRNDNCEVEIINENCE